MAVDAHPWRRNRVGPKSLRRTGPSLAVTAAAALLCWVGAATAAQGDRLVILLVLAGLSVVAVLGRFYGACIFLVLLGASVLPDRAFRFSVAGVQTDIFESLAFLVIATWLLLLLRGSVHRPRFVLPWTLFLLAVVIGLYVGYLGGSSFPVLLGQGKAYAFYVLPLVFSSAFATRDRQDFLGRWVLTICDLGSAVLLLALATGMQVVASVTPRVMTLGTELDAQRIRTPLLDLLVLGLLLVLGRVIDRGLCRPDLLRLAAYTTVVLLSFNRSTWIPLMAAAMLLVLLRRPPGSGARMLRYAVALTVVVTISFGLAAAGSLGSTGLAASRRIVSTVDPSVLQENSYQDRAGEDEDAIRTLRGSPLLGVGLGQPYGARRFLYFDNPPRLVFYDRTFIHNSYLGIWLRLGVLGLIAVLLLAIAVARETRLATRSAPVHLRTQHLVAGLAMLVFAASALFQTSLAYRPSILAMSCALALVPRGIESAEGLRD